MTVSCKMVQCPYFDSGFCAKGTIGIDQNGMCNVIWKRGQRRFLNFESIYKHPITVIIAGDGEIKEDESV